MTNNIQKKVIDTTILEKKLFLADFIVREESGVVSREYGGHTMSVFSFCPLEVPQLK